jgi:TP901 family phage tail tape measure protein
MAGSVAATKAGGAYVTVGADDSALARGLRRAEARVRAFGASVQAVGRTRIGFGVAAAVPFVAAVRGFASYEDALASLRAASNPTAEDLEKVEAAVADLSKATGVGPAKVTAAMTELLKAGLPLKAVLGGATAAALQFARVAEMDVAEAATILTDAMNVFGVDATRAVDTFSRAADASSISVRDVTMAFSQASAVAKLAGLSIEETANAIAILGQNGVKGSDAGTSLKTMMLRLLAPTEEAAKVVQELKINVREAGGGMKDMRGIIAELQAKFAGLKGATRDLKLAKLFGTDAIRAGSIFLRDGVQGWDEFNAKMGEGLPVGAKFAILMGTMSGGAQRMMAAVERAAIAIGRALAPSVAALSGRLATAADVLALLAKNNQGFVLGLAKGVAVVAGIGAALYAAGAAARLLAVGIGVLRGAAIVAVAAINTLKVATIALGVAASVSSALTGLAAAAATLLTPVGLINAAFIAGAAALGYWLVTSGNASAALGALGRGFADLKGVAVEAFGGIAEALKSGDIAAAGRILWATLKLEWAKGVAYLASLTAPLERAWIDALTAIRSSFVATSAAIQGAWLVTVYAIRESWAATTLAVARTWNAAAGVLSAGFAFLSAVFEPVAYTMQALWGATMVYLRAEWAVFSASFKATWAVLLSGWGITTAIIGGLWGATVAVMKAEWAVFSASFRATARVLEGVARISFGILGLEIRAVVSLLGMALKLMEDLVKKAPALLAAVNPALPFILKGLDAAKEKLLEAKGRDRALRDRAGAAGQGRRDDLQAQLAAIDEQRRKAMAGLEAGAGAGKAGLDDRAAGLDAQVADARKEFEDALAAAKAPGADAEARDFLGQLDQRLADATAANRQGRGAGAITPEGLDAGMAEARKGVGVDVQGTFSASAIRGLGAGESVTDAVKDNNKELKKINDRLRKAGPLVFNEP